ncbi:MAG: excinuclease ABC subunit UvrC [Acidobacteria bacterium]|nr:excinuclease ABC subunit UvrC [Acidobacteriota bacterium]
MAIRDLKAQISRLPEQPGVYLYANAAGETIYIGRARALRDRVRSYLSAYGTSPKTTALLDEVTSLEVIVTDSLVEALALESHLIKQRMPRFNILLRDDKSYPYLQVTTAEDFPRVMVARRVARDGNYYAGPFLPATLARKTMSLTHKLFGIRSCNEVITGRRDRACLEYDIKRCVAPCVESLCTQEQYAEAVTHARMFLDGRNDELVTELKDQMHAASDALRFEEAAQARDAIKTIETLRDRQQKMSSVRLGDRDAFGIKTGPAGAVIQVFQMRGGRVIERVELVADAVAGETPSPEETVQAAVQQFYAGRVAPPDVHLPVAIEDLDAVEHWLGQAAGRKVRLSVPQRGDKRGLLDLAARNAALGYRTRYSDEAMVQGAALDELRVALGLPGSPRRIECFDISTIQGSETVGSMVVCEDGRMTRKAYRKFKVRGGDWGAERTSLTEGPRRKPSRGRRLASDAPAHGARAAEVEPRLLDDFAAMREVVARRYRRLLDDGEPPPDLVVIDGGKGQLSAAYEAFANLGQSNLVAVGLAKKEELVFTRDAAEPIIFETNSPALLLLQRIRDEAHRFAVTYHRTSRTRRDFRSELDDIPGVGSRRRRMLLTRFGSVASIRRATREELVPVLGDRVADAVLGHFAERTAGRADLP